MATNPDNAAEAAVDATKGAAVGAAVGAGLWGLVGPVVSSIGFTANGIAAGSTAAAMMSSAAVANGGGVAAGGLVATCQSIGAVGLATSVGLGLVVGGAAIGGSLLAVKSFVSNRGQGGGGGSPDGDWVLVELTAGSSAPQTRSFPDEKSARAAFAQSSAPSKALFGPDEELVMSSGWQETLDATDATPLELPD